MSNRQATRTPTATSEGRIHPGRVVAHPSFDPNAPLRYEHDVALVFLDKAPSVRPMSIGDATPGEQAIYVGYGHYESESGATYDLQLDYTKFDDPYEPNDSREEARSIAKNETIHAVAVGGIAGKTTVEPEHYDDWFSVDLTAGEVEVKVTIPDPRAMMGGRLFDATGKQIGGESGTRGADLVLRETIGTAGRYFVRVRLVGRSFVDILSGGVNDEVPKSFTPYGLRIEQ